MNINPNCSLINKIDLNSWHPPPIGTMKLNCDGSVRNCGRSAGCGGILRDCYGRLVFAFAQKLEECTVCEAELWGLYHGISIAWGLGYSKFMVETDSQDALEALQSGIGREETFQMLVKGILEIGDGELEIEWLKASREFNVATDMLAKSSHTQRDSCVIFNIVPDFLVNVLASDCVGLPSPSNL